MKIGISAIGYNCAEHLDKVLSPWIQKYDDFEILISIAHGLFPEYEKLGFPIESQDGTIGKIQKYQQDGFIGSFSYLTTPTYEKDIRNVTLPYLLDNEVDYIMLLDLQDEIYTPEDIKKIVNFIKMNEFISSFNINFKNYIIDNNHYVNNFIAPRIWNNKLNGGIKEFYYDNEILFNNGKTAKDSSCITIPQNIAFIKHLSWVGSQQYLQNKINFQKIHYGQCSYKMENGVLKLDDDYYIKNGINKPIIYKD